MIAQIAHICIGLHHDRAWKIKLLWSRLYMPLNKACMYMKIFIACLRICFIDVYWVHKLCYYEIFRCSYNTITARTLMMILYILRHWWLLEDFIKVILQPCCIVSNFPFLNIKRTKWKWPLIFLRKVNFFSVTIEKIWMKIQFTIQVIKENETVQTKASYIWH